MQKMQKVQGALNPYETQPRLTHSGPPVWIDAERVASFVRLDEGEKAPSLIVFSLVDNSVVKVEQEISNIEIVTIGDGFSEEFPLTLYSKKNTYKLGIKEKGFKILEIGDFGLSIPSPNGNYIAKYNVDKKTYSVVDKNSRVTKIEMDMGKSGFRPQWAELSE